MIAAKVSVIRPICAVLAECRPMVARRGIDDHLRVCWDRLSGFRTRRGWQRNGAVAGWRQRAEGGRRQLGGDLSAEYRVPVVAREAGSPSGESLVWDCSPNWPHCLAHVDIVLVWASHLVAR